MVVTLSGIVFGAIVIFIFCLWCGVMVDSLTRPRLEDTIEDEGSEIVTGKEAEDVKVEDELWISDKGVVHNSLCRWYKECDGSVFNPEQTEFTNCGLCGGTEPIVRKWNLTPQNEDIA